jgi:hypothetical protein
MKRMEPGQVVAASLTDLPDEVMLSVPAQVIPNSWPVQIDVLLLTGAVVAARPR